MSLPARINPVIVNFRTPDLTLKCVASIVQQGVAAPEDILVVENASPDDSLARLQAELRHGRLIVSSRNGGFGAGVNLGASQAQREFVLVLNPDTYFTDQSIAAALAVLDGDASVGLVGLNLVYPDGERQYSARRFYSFFDVLVRRSPLGKLSWLQGVVDRHLMKRSWDAGSPFEAEWVMGTGFVVRRELYQRLGGMDEAYFLYMEDVDLCARVWQAGFKVVCVPAATLVHDHQRSSASNPLGWAARMHIKSLARFARKFRVPVLVPPGVAGLWR